MRKPVYILLLLLIPACSFSQSQPTPSIVLDTFKSLPKDIDGCAETCAYKDTPLKAEKYVWITNMQELGMIKVGGKVIRLHKVSETASGKNHKEVYKGEGYIVVTKMKEVVVKESEETSYIVGTLEITYGGKVTTFVIHGTAGC